MSNTQPWLTEPDHVQFEAHGFPCIIHRNGSGAWCGYVGVPPDHPLHGVHYGDVDLDFEVHGGLTYSEPCQGDICHKAKPGEPDDVYWFGFDCNHGFDYAPRQSFPNMVSESEYRDQAYVTAETTKLAAQLRERTQAAS